MSGILFWKCVNWKVIDDMKLRWVRVDRMMVIVMIGFWEVVSKEVESVEGEHKKVKDKRNVRSERLEGMKVMKLESW